MRVRRRKPHYLTLLDVNMLLQVKSCVPAASHVNLRSCHMSFLHAALQLCPRGSSPWKEEPEGAGIDGLEEKLAHCRQSIEEVDLKLRREKLSPEGRKSLERERNLLMTKADNYEKELSVLRKENRKNAALAVAMGLLIALIYAWWMM
ncbi:coiled-coil domain-containing protein 167 isoform X1 [Strix aluco]|uniref:coiled-coil domain-containing protein 167 isoform X1 n=1 Tax=Strix aluco TaxID=111821 RepID=UPI003DA30714